MKINLLIVDDEPEICNLLSRHFRFLGYEVDTACDGRDALRKVKATNYHVVISDIRMPGMDGVDLLQAIKSYDGGTHVIMITGHVAMESVLACRRRGADTCLFKPLDDLAELEACVEAAVADMLHWQEILRQLRGVPAEQLGEGCIEGGPA